MNNSDIKKIIEALIFCHETPVTLAQLKQALEVEYTNETLRGLLAEIADEWRERSIELVQVATGWRFQSAPQLRPYLDRLRSEKPVTYSRAILETLAIIAYRQPVTRGDIEDIRGVTVSSGIIKTLEERGWIDEVGRREVVGRPALFATTKQFLADLGLNHVRELPDLVQNADAQSAPQLPGFEELIAKASLEANQGDLLDVDAANRTHRSDAALIPDNLSLTDGPDSI